jgi:uncharacterized peroxidase-related enzyme
MSHVKQLSEDQASGTLRRVYDAATARAGSVAQIIQVQSLDARALQASVGFYVSLMKSKNVLDPALREMIAVVVSNVNQSFYCALFHAQDYAEETGNKKRAESLIYDYRKAGLDEKERALCEYAVKLTLRPAEVKETDLVRLREQGYNDEAIVVATQIVGYMNYITRVANALGVEEESWMSLDPEEWLKKKGKDYLSKSK